MADDAFYYFDIARRFPHISASPGLTTTGFHPLYWMTLIPIFRVAHGFAAVRLALVTLLVVHVVAGLMLYWLLRRTWSTWASALVAAAWMASAGLRTIVLLGVETAWVELALIGLLLVCTTDRPASTMAPWVGAMLAVCYLARNDSVIVAGAIALAWMWDRRPDRRSILRLAGTSLLISLPWIAFLAAHHSLLGTDSARALSLSRPGLVTRFRSMTGLVVSRTASLVLNRYFPGRETSTATFVVLFVAVVFAVALILIKKTAWSPYEIALVASVPILFLAYGVQLGAIRDWYLVYLNVTLFVVVFPPIAEAVVRMLAVAVDVRHVSYAVVSITALLGIAASLAPSFGLFPEEQTKYLAAKAIRPTLAHERIGSFNSGIYTFVLDDATVENLDGVVNPLVHPYLKQRTMCQYFRDRHLTWFLDDTGDAQSLTRLGGPQARAQVIVPSRHALPAQVLLRITPTPCPSK
jgi:hypothetical protein